MRERRRGHVERDEVLATAVEVAVELGLPVLTAAAVAERLGVKERAVSRLWPDDESLVAMTFAQIVGKEIEEAEREVLALPTPTEQLMALLDTLAEPVGHLDAAWAEAWSLGRRNAALGAVVRSEETAWHTLVAAVVRRGVQSGDFVEVDPDQVATHLLAVIDGVNAYSLVGYQSNIDRLRMLHAVAGTYLGTAQRDPAADEPADGA